MALRRRVCLYSTVARVFCFKKKMCFFLKKSFFFAARASTTGDDGTNRRRAARETASLGTGVGRAGGAADRH